MNTAEQAEANREMATYELRDLRRAHAKTIAWLDACAAYSAGEGPAPIVKRMPSKDHKHRMYASADRVRRLLDLDMQRPVGMDGIAAAIALATEALATP